MSMDEAIQLARLAATNLPSDPLLIRGESGAGKSLVAGAYADAVDGSLVHVNCSNLEPSRAAADLFGHVKGAYTGATASRPGLLAEADGGVLWLDEVHHLPKAVQARLLTWLDTGEFRAVGSTNIETARCALIVSTNVDLLEAARRGEFLHDLYHRIAVLEVTVPPLRERPDDVESIAEQSAASRGMALGPDALEWLRTCQWETEGVPGNARRLDAVVARGALRARAQGVRAIRATHLGAPARKAARKSASPVVEVVKRQPGISSGDLAEALGVHRHTARRRAIANGLVQRDGRKGGWYLPE